jgi:hypothetical protein
MSPRKIVRGLLGVVLAGAAWTGTAGLAHAGGPTSVLIVNPSAHRATGLYYTEAPYDELARAIGGGGDQSSGSLGKPASVDLDGPPGIRLTWMIHDVSVWRIDGIYITRSDGIWISTLIDQGSGGNLRDRPGHWHRPQNDGALLAVLKSAGILTSNAAPEGDSSPQASPAAASTAVAAGGPNPPQTPARTVAVVAALAGLVLGAAGLMLRRARHANRERFLLRG